MSDVREISVRDFESRPNSRHADAARRRRRDAAMQALLIAAAALKAIARRLLRRVTRVLSLRAPPPQYLNPATGATFSLDAPRWCLIKRSY